MRALCAQDKIIALSNSLATRNSEIINTQLPSLKQLKNDIWWESIAWNAASENVKEFTGEGN